MRPQRKHNRLVDFDYAADGAYFVTICTKDRACFFGEVRDDKMQLNDVGRVARRCWEEIPWHFPQASLDEFVVMPNHVHVIIIMDSTCVGAGHAPPVQQGTRHALSLHSTVSSIIGSFKSASSKYIHRETSCIDFAWQRSFHDHIIRNETDLARIRDYITNNPLRWALDEYHA